MITVPNLRITPGTQCQQRQNWYPYLRMENLRNYTPHWVAYTYLAYLWEYPRGLKHFPKWLQWKSLTPRYCDSFWIELNNRTYLYSWLHIVNPFLFPLQEIMEKEISLSNRYLVWFIRDCAASFRVGGLKKNAWRKILGGAGGGACLWISIQFL